mmetsp:Transcript_13653/g.34328  ORF Transcript_13653/g.34328 Transcript_13653/m.34328 type:complete len:1329 (+) Transcript_13653:241-4227(+)|eukprot:CAMPEP_0173439420 /NCGR_PEP_ID=MMETSP1357-20121228/20941_1 /TAXON_ID=77926 /ORGANISM="Hemiselmis rufescens, Strain PCC563" /LENGTH=1328 /DNA_ID=CAMNT_0014404789 /DNA_START=223 /DNA_END=4209 /DNA_ORIENTATION=+
MTTLETMAIAGIRSYYPNDKGVINFQKPLTLILGANGCGKTTIIESLRMATTGKLPPSSGHGSSFIHDAKLSGITETKGYIKLKFQDVSGKEIVITRNFQATNKPKGNVEYKQTEANLKEKATGKATTHKCSEVDSLVPLMMGVSSAVLEHVIFCHQEESNWVLGEPKMLKERFDAIFASSRYSKALENIKKLQNEQKIVIKGLEGEEANFSTLKEIARKTRLDMEGHIEKKEECSEKVKQAEKEIQKLKRDIAKLEEVLQESSEIEGRKTDITKDLRNLKDRLDPLEQNLDGDTEYTAEDIPKLNKMRNEMVNELENRSGERRVAEDEIKKAERLVNKRSEKLEQARQLESDLKAENASFRKRLEEWRKKGREVSDKLGLGFSDEQLKNEGWEAKPSALSRKVKDVVDKKESEEREFKKRHTQERDQIQTKVTELTMKTENSTQRQLAISAERRQLDQTLSNEKKEISTLQSKVATLADRTAAVEQRQSDLERKQNSFDEKAKRRELEDLNQKEMETKNRKRQLQEEQRQVNQDYDKHLIHAANVKARDALEGEISDIIGTRDHEVRSALGRLPEADEIQEQLADHARDMSTKFEDIRRRHQQAMDGKNKVDHKKANVKELLKEQEDVLQRLEVETSDLKVNGGQIKQWEHERAKPGQSRVEACAATIKRLNEKKAHLEKKKEEGKAFAKLADSYIDTAQEKHVCGLCLRGFDHDGKFEDFLAMLQQSKKSSEVSAEEQEKFKSEMAYLDQAVAVMEQASTTFQKASNAQEQISRFQEQIAQLDQELEGQPMGDQDEMNAAESKMSEARNLEKWASGLRISELQRLTKDVKEGEADFGGDGNANGRKEELDRLLEEADAQLDELSREKDSRQGDINTYNTELAKKKEELSSAKVQLDLLTVEAKKLDECRKRVTATEQKVESLQKELAQLKDQKLPDEEELKTCRATLSRIQAEHGSVEAKVSSEAKNLGAVFHSLQSLEGDIFQYVVQGKDKTLALQKDEKEKLEKEVEESKQEKERKENELRKLSGNSQEAESKMRTLNDILEFVNINIKIKKLEGQLVSEQEKIKNIPEEGEVQQMLKKFHADKDKKTEEAHKMKGQMSILTQNIKENEKELASDKFRGIEEKHKLAHVKLVATRSSNQDLQRYYVALDRALMKFHEMKMEEINKIIKEYWQATYKGVDIETIEIRADVDTSGTRRSHNYRLVMKHRTEAQLDMRGRCSAGQKVLAALVVRLALAESFCHNCGVLALDEPTSNLDHANIDGFTDALSRIVKDRAKTGFQLIIISHDDDFIEKLAKDTEVGQYWRVSKDADAKSRIQSHAVNLLG